MPFPNRTAFPNIQSYSVHGHFSRPATAAAAYSTTPVHSRGRCFRHLAKQCCSWTTATGLMQRWRASSFMHMRQRFCLLRTCAWYIHQNSPSSLFLVYLSLNADESATRLAESLPPPMLCSCSRYGGGERMLQYLTMLDILMSHLHSRPPYTAHFETPLPLTSPFLSSNYTI